MLHFIGASIILMNGLHFLQAHDFNKSLCYFQVIIAIEIFSVLLLGGKLLINAPVLNIFFRITESLTLAGMGFILINFGHIFYGWFQLVLSLGFFFLYYREWRIMRSESINIRQTGISIPNFMMDKEIGWKDIKSIVPKYHTIIIETIGNKRIEFELRRNLKIEELQQIDEFCRQHLIS